LAIVAAQLNNINKHAALRVTPEQHRHAIVQAANGLMREAMQKLDRATQDAERKRRQLADPIGVVRDERDQRLWLIAIPVMVAFVTLFASPVLLVATLRTAAPNCRSHHERGPLERWLSTNERGEPCLVREDGDALQHVWQAKPSL
jgi:hypothetical protein